MPDKAVLFDLDGTLLPMDFELVTTYDNCTFCKPTPQYYRDLADRLGLAPDECLMVGNDVGDDMVAETVGMRVFLLTDNLINKKNTEISAFPHGGFAEFLSFLKQEGYL